jgi:hypothetical protein
MTLGVFRVRSRGALDADELANTHVELLYYHDGLSTTVTVERYWGTHLAMKNNGKVDARTARTCPRRSTSRPTRCSCTRTGPEGLDVAIIGFGSGVTVGTALRSRCAQRRRHRARARGPRGRALVRGVQPPRLPPRELPVRGHGAPRGHQRRRAQLPRRDRARVRRDHQRAQNPWITGVSDLFTRSTSASASGGCARAASTASGCSSTS